MPARLRLAQVPTPVEQVGGARPFWVKREDRSSALYGGNKVRKLEFLLADARRRRLRTLVTAGAWGSHHALATSLFGVQAGFRVVPILVPQPPDAHVLANRQRTHAAASEIVDLPHAALLPCVLPWVFARARRFGTVGWIPVGGSSPIGALGYVLAAHELRAQVDAGLCPRPAALVVPLGSGGTVLGLWVGLAEAFAQPPALFAVRVVGRLLATRPLLAWRARKLRAQLARWRGRPIPRLGPMHVVHDQSGTGYGHPTEAARRAQKQYGSLGLELTYGAKALAALLELAAGPFRGRPVLFIHTGPGTA